MPDPLKLEAQFNRASISTRDFEEVEEYLTVFRDDLPDPLKRAVLVAAIVAYARPFTQNDGGGEALATSTLLGNPNRVLSDEEFSLHEELLRLRNEALAHSDYDRKPSRFVAVIGTGFLAKGKPFDVLSERIDVTTFRSMAAKMKNHCTDIRFRLSRELGSQSTEP
jgi:hypothetical protein